MDSQGLGSSYGFLLVGLILQINDLIKIIKQKEKQCLMWKWGCVVKCIECTHPFTFRNCIHSPQENKQQDFTTEMLVCLLIYLRVNHWNLGTRWVQWYYSLSVRYSCSFSWRAFKVLTKNHWNSISVIKTESRNNFMSVLHLQMEWPLIYAMNSHVCHLQFTALFIFRQSLMVFSSLFLYLMDY